MIRVGAFLLTMAWLLVPTLARAEFSASVSDRSSSGIGITIRSPFDVLPEQGVYPLSVSIINDTSMQHTWSLTLASGGWSGNGETRRTFTVGAHKSERFDIFLDLPSQAASSYPSTPYVQTTMAGYGVEYASHSLPNANSSYNSAFTPYIVMSDSFRGIFDRLHSEWSGSQPGAKAAKKAVSDAYPALSSLLDGRLESLLLLGSLCPPSNLPADWRGYLGVNQIWLSELDWAGLPPPPRDAIKQWLLQGGQLVLFDPHFTDAAISEWSLVPQDGRMVADFGAGVVYGYQLDANTLSSRVASEIVSLAKSKHLPFLSGATTTQDRYTWKLIPEKAGNMAVGAIVVLTIVAYAFLVGPINVFYYARNNRAFLYVTTPLISIAATVALCVFIILRDGIGGSGDRYVTVVVSAKDKQQIVVQQDIVRTGLLLRRNFRLPDGAVIRPVSLSLEGDNGSSGGYSRASQLYANSNLDLARQDSDYVGDWFRNRSTFAHLIQTVGPTRARVELIPGEDAAPKIFSSIDATLDELYYVDGAGNVWKAQNVSPGNKTPLAKSSKGELSGFLDQQRKLMGHASDDLVSRLSSRPQYFFGIARNGASEAFQTLPSIRWKTTTVMFLGEIVEASS